MTKPKGNPSKYRPEVDLLVCCSRARMDEATASRIRSLFNNSLDWDYINNFSLQHRILPLLYRNLSEVCPGLVPTATLNHLSHLYQENSARNHRLTAELIRILSLLESSGIPAIPFKGPNLALELYGDLALRQCDDLDLLVRREDVLQVERLLIGRGYHPELDLSAEARFHCLKIHDEYTYRRADPEIKVDIHWRILPRSYSIPFDCSPLLARAESEQATGGGMPKLQPEILLLMLCLHGYMHRWQRLCWLSDISELVRAHAELSWESVLQQATDMRCRRILLLGLCLAHDLYETPLPESICRAIEMDQAVRKLCLEVAEYLLGRSTFKGELFPLTFFQVRARERMQDRVRHCCHSALSVTALDYLYMPLPRFLACLYPLLRPFRLAQKYVLRGTWQR